jgi:hypothetical protein
MDNDLCFLYIGRDSAHEKKGPASDSEAGPFCDS